MNTNTRKKWDKDNFLIELPIFENTETETNKSISRWRLKTHKYIHKNIQKLTKKQLQIIF